MGRLGGKVAVVTRANSGIGLATAKRFAREGTRLFITGRRQPELDAAVRAVGGKTTGVRGDVSNLADLDRLYDVVREEAGVIDILFANAGGGEFMLLQEITEDHCDRTFATNVACVGQRNWAKVRLGSPTRCSVESGLKISWCSEHPINKVSTTTFLG